MSAPYPVVFDTIRPERFDRPETAARFDVTPSGIPTVGTAIVRLLTSIPSAIVLGVLAVIAMFVWLIAAVSIIVARKYPAAPCGYQRAVVRWAARLLAYHTSIDRYTPFAIDTKPEPSPGRGCA